MKLHEDKELFREMPALAFAAIPSARQVLTSFKAVASKLR